MIPPTRTPLSPAEVAALEQAPGMVVLAAMGAARAGVPVDWQQLREQTKAHCDAVLSLAPYGRGAKGRRTLAAAVDADRLTLEAIGEVEAGGDLEELLPRLAEGLRATLTDRKV